MAPWRLRITPFQEGALASSDNSVLEVLDRPGSSSSPMPSNARIIEKDGRRFIDADKYLNNLKPWAAGLSNLPDVDHIMAFTGLDLYSGSLPEGAGVVGMAWMRKACTSEKNSINEDMGFIQTTSTAAHELGHKYLE
ncbi:hypothetical protein MAR_002508, partial [Mya arenaria]